MYTVPLIIFAIKFLKIKMNFLRFANFFYEQENRTVYPGILLPHIGGWGGEVAHDPISFTSMKFSAKILSNN